MIDADKRGAIWTLYKQGKGKKEIARLLDLDPKTIRRVIQSQGRLPDIPRKDKKRLDPTLVENVFKRCQGWGRRTHEVLIEEYGVEIGYSTLIRLLDELGLKNTDARARCEEVEVKPGAEMQHDTSPYVLSVGGRPTRVQCAGLYYRYSKVRYIKFYRSFDKFAMKSFMYEAASFWKFTAGICVIDNTSLAVLRGTGRNAIFHDDMNSLARRLGFEWLAHELGHADRKGGKERNFWTVETNFIPGRTFRDMEDLNRQALEWATVRYFRRPHEKTKLIPAEVWEHEKPYLTAVPDYVEPPYREHDRDTDRYGYVSMHANYYWVPGTKRESVKVIEYPGRIKIFKNRQMLIEYPLRPVDVKYDHVKPDGAPAPRKSEHVHLSSEAEEIKLRAGGETMERYLDFIRTPAGAVRYRNRFIKDLYGVSLRIAPVVFLKAIERALQYQINNPEVIERIAVQMMKSELHEWPDIPAASAFQERPAYQEGRLSDEPDLLAYGKLLKPDGGNSDGSGPEDL